MAVRIVTLILLLWLVGFPVPAAVLAQGGLALSGSFHNQNFVIPQGSSVSGPSIDVVVFNNGSEAINIRMLSQSPPGVTISFSNQQFSIPPGGQQQVLIGVAVAADVAPGDYDLSVTAQSYKEGGTGIQVAGAAGQTARLKVTGESAQVDSAGAQPRRTAGDSHCTPVPGCQRTKTRRWLTVKRVPCRLPWPRVISKRPAISAGSR